MKANIENSVPQFLIIREEDIRRAAKMVVDGNPFFCDAGMLNDKYFAYVAAFGFSIMGKTISPSFDEDFGIKKGFDLAGGSVIVFEPDVEVPASVSDEDISAALLLKTPAGERPHTANG